MQASKIKVGDWEDTERRRNAQAAARSTNDRRILGEAEAFEWSEIIATTSLLKAAGLKNVAEGPGGLSWDGGSLSFKRERTSDNHVLITGWSKAAQIEREHLFELLNAVADSRVA
jgi:hypothetical protein